MTLHCARMSMVCSRVKIQSGCGLKTALAFDRNVLEVGAIVMHGKGTVPWEREAPSMPHHPPTPSDFEYVPINDTSSNARLSPSRPSVC
mmetsp:Transcript_37646/g.100137  ORF Transcript_37646/g.100137 Transcript_37646/m.100137 type:complete len:89 (-) Transcript_37646:802-1068(-)